jgi:Domain of unknown function (DUF4118)
VLRPVIAYPLVVAALGTALLLRWLLDPFLGDALPLVTLFGAVAAAVWLGGHRPAIVIAILGYLAVHICSSRPEASSALTTAEPWLGPIAYGRLLA